MVWPYLLQLIDGTDIQRIQNSQSVLYAERIGDEQLFSEMQRVDKEFRNKSLQEARADILSALSEGFGAASAVRALEAFSQLADGVISYHPNSVAARAAGRLVYLAAAIACASIDYVSVGAAFRTAEERRELILNAIRLGALSNDQGKQALRIALALVEKYAPGGKATALAVQSGLRKDLEKIPAEIVADQAVRLLKSDQLFLTGRELEMAAYCSVLPTFDQLGGATKSMLGALLDYSNVDRERFAVAWTGTAPAQATSEKETTEGSVKEASQQPTLFNAKGS